MTPLHSNLTPARHWKDIPQEVSPRAMSSEGRRRLVLGIAKTVVVTLFLGAAGWGGYVLTSALRETPGQIPAAVKSAPLKDLVLVTDGVLDQAWLAKALAVPKGASLMELDLFQLRARLLASGQVRTATVTRNFPTTLAVTLAERMPVARLQVQDQSDAARTLLVARDGTVYDGVGYDAKMVETLPWIAGVKLTRQSGVFQPIVGMENVADLLAKTRLEAEHLYVGWTSVSLARLESDGEIEIGTKDGLKIIFGTNEDFFRQLAMLDAITDAAKAHPEKAARVINLAVGGQVPVAFADAAPAETGTPPAKSKAPIFTGLSHP